MFIIKLFYSVLLILMGMGIIKYRRNVKSWTGNLYWAEHYIGSGGTYLVLIALGLAMIFYGVIYPMGGIQFILGD